MNGVNLLPGPVVLTRKRRYRRAIWTRSLLVYCVALLAGVLAVEGVLIEPVAALEAKSKALDSDLVAAEAHLELQQQHARSLTAEVQVLNEIHGQPDWSVLLVHLSEHLGGSVSIRSVRVAMTGDAGSIITPGRLARGPYRIEMSGVAGAQADVTEYVLRLENAGLLQGINLQGTSPTRVGDAPAVLFSLDAAIGVEDKR